MYSSNISVKCLNKLFPVSLSVCLQRHNRTHFNGREHKTAVKGKPSSSGTTVVWTCPSNQSKRLYRVENHRLHPRFQELLFPVASLTFSFMKKTLARRLKVHTRRHPVSLSPLGNSAVLKGGKSLFPMRSRGSLLNVELVAGAPVMRRLTLSLNRSRWY